MGVAWGALPPASWAAAAQPPSSVASPELVGLRLPSRRRVLVSRSFLLILGPGNCVGQRWGWGVGSGGGAGEQAGGCEILGQLSGVSAAGDGKYPGLAECFFRQPLGSVRFLGVSGRACLAFPFFLCADILGSTSRRGILTQGFPPGGLVCVAFCEVWL